MKPLNNIEHLEATVIVIWCYINKAQLNEQVVMSPFHCRNKTHIINAFNVKIDIGLNNKMATRVGMPVTSIQTDF